MEAKALNQALGTMSMMIITRLKTEQEVASAASACAGSGSHETGFKLMLKVEPIHEANTLLQAACILRLET